jgi:hypothetical protein
VVAGSVRDQPDAHAELSADVGEESGAGRAVGFGERAGGSRDREAGDDGDVAAVFRQVAGGECELAEADRGPIGEEAASGGVAADGGLMAASCSSMSAMCGLSIEVGRAGCSDWSRFSRAGGTTRGAGKCDTAGFCI